MCLRLITKFEDGTSFEGHLSSTKKRLNVCANVIRKAYLEGKINDDLKSQGVISIENDMTQSMEQFAITNSPDENEKTWCVYQHTLKGGELYFGITWGATIEECNKNRWHNGLGYKDQLFGKYMLQHCCWGDVSHRILQTGLTKEDALRWEDAVTSTFKQNGFKVLTEKTDCNIWDK